MRVTDWKSVATTACAILAIGVVLSATAKPPRSSVGRSPQAIQTAAQEVTLSVDTARSKVNWTVDSTLHMVHGTFALKSGTLNFESASGKASGEIVVLTSSGESGNSSRDEKMHKEVLESAKYPEAVFRPTQVEGKVANSGGSEVKLHGSLLLQGTIHELVVPVHAELTGESWKGTGKFEVPYIQWGLKNPSNFMLKVQPIVNVELELSGAVNKSR
jgi:polyisoprenoid-binding protein YceI